MFNTVKKNKPYAFKQNMNETYRQHSVEELIHKKVHLYEVQELIFDDENQKNG